MGNGLDKPKQGKTFTLYVYSFYNNRSYVDGVQVTLWDVIRNTHKTHITGLSGEQHGFTEFEVTIGNTYDVTARFFNSVMSASCTIQRTYVGIIGKVDIIISENDTLESITCQEVGLM